ncbi:hypothetical protein DCO46_15490 [Flavobacterium sp. HTF]|nr:hypothetical protein DCO46_15490 [Flavobacterium sp. HTF]
MGSSPSAGSKTITEMWWFFFARILNLKRDKFQILEFQFTQIITFVSTINRCKVLYLNVRRNDKNSSVKTVSPCGAANAISPYVEMTRLNTHLYEDE